MAGQIAYVGGLLCGKSQRAHARGAEFQDGLRRDYALDGGRQAAENDAGHASAELLEDDGLDQGLEIRRREIGYHNRQPVR